MELLQSIPICLADASQIQPASHFPAELCPSSCSFACTSCFALWSPCPATSSMRNPSKSITLRVSDGSNTGERGEELWCGPLAVRVGVGEKNGWDVEKLCYRPASQRRQLSASHTEHAFTPSQLISLSEPEACLAHIRIKDAGFGSRTISPCSLLHKHAQVRCTWANGGGRLGIWTKLFFAQSKLPDVCQDSGLCWIKN